MALLIVIAPPLFGWLRFDFWGGNHLLWGESLSFLEVFQGFVVPFFAINAAILIITHQLGRFLCGWICPTGVISRWAEELEYLLYKNFGQAYYAAIGVISLVVAAGGMLWFVDPQVMIAGSGLAKTLTVLAWLLLAGLVFFEMNVWRLGFCRVACPSGVYFAILAQKSQTAVTLENRDDAQCLNCNACMTVCPVELNPKDLSEKQQSTPGLYFDGMNQLSRCLRCGDCVRACDLIFDKKNVPGVLNLGFIDNDFDLDRPQLSKSSRLV